MKKHTVPLLYEIGFHVLDKWLKLKIEGKTLQKYFDDNRIKTVAIYGMAALGNRLYEDLQNTDIQVLYAIDRNASNIKVKDLKIVTLEDKLDKVDAVIVTPIQFFYAIEADLEKVIDTDIISLEDVVEYCV